MRKAYSNLSASRACAKCAPAGKYTLTSTTHGAQVDTAATQLALFQEPGNKATAQCKEMYICKHRQIGRLAAVNRRILQP